MNLAGKTALVTGAGRGIGRGCALALAEAGADIVVNDRPECGDLNETVAAIAAVGRRAVAIRADVFSRSGCEQLVDAALAAVSGIDILISNPAFGRRSPFLEFDPELFERTIAGTLTAGFHLSQLVARQMVACGGGGKLVFISSVQASVPYAHSVAYNAAKAGLNHMLRTIAVELAQHRINVNGIEPGWIDTPGERATFSEPTLRSAAAKLPWGRLGTPADIGQAAVFLASPAADYITGSVLRVDGGFVLKDLWPWIE